MQETMHVPATAEEHAHPGPRVYVAVAVVLAIITLVEVAIFYVPEMLGMPHLWSALVAGFIVLSTIKFVTVVGYYMHLKFDAKVFLYIFSFFLLIALGVAVAFIALFHGLYLL